MRILITGSSSFIGFHLIKFLSKKHSVFWTTTKKVKNYVGIRKVRLNKLEKKNNIILNLNNKNNLEKIFIKYKFDYIFLHHAYTKNANDNQIFNLKKAISVNLKYLEDIFLLSKKYGVKKIIQTGTNQEYGNYNTKIKESFCKRPNSLYGLSKLMQSNYCNYLSNYFKVSCVSLKVFNVFGQLDNPKKVTSFVLKNIINNKVSKLSSCTQIRDFIFVKDLCKYFEKSMTIKNKSYYEEFNVCSSKNITLKNFLLKICKLSNKNKNLLNFGKIKIRKGENQFNLGSNSKIKKKFNFHVNFNKSIKDYINSV